MIKELRLTTFPDGEEILRAPNALVEFPLSQKILDLIENMKHTVKKAPGIGLAAPQIGVNLRLAVINFEDMGIKPFAIINPKIISRSIKKDVMEEGCLSIPQYFQNIKRPSRVTVEFQDVSGRLIRMKADRLLAKVFQHEIDHLDGTLIKDKSHK